MKRYEMMHCYNFRDLGGCPSATGFFPDGVFFRSDAPINLTKEEIDQIYHLGVRTVIDLRYPDESERRYSSLTTDKRFTCYNISLGTGSLPESEEAIPESYLQFVQNEMAMQPILEILAHSDHATLFHCTAGKDRTGVIAAILYLLADCKEEDIIADYQVSYTFIKKIIERLRRDNPDLPAYAGQSKPEYMEQFLQRFHQSYGSITNYLRAISLTEETMIKLKEKVTYI